MNWNPFNTAKKKRIADLRARISMLDTQLELLEDISRCRNTQFNSLFRSYVDQYGEDTIDWPGPAVSLLEDIEASQLRIFKEHTETIRAIHTLAVELRNS